MQIRAIKSFILRQGRLTQRQEHALTELSQHYILPTETQADWKKIFSCDAPVIVEIGFGMGHALISNAQARPDYNFVGIEVFRPGIGALLAELKAKNIANVRIFYKDATDVFKQCVPDNSLDAIHIFFPDPWPKRRHHKRRLIQPLFVQLMARKLKIGGKLHLATDWEDYAVHMLKTLHSVKQLSNLAQPANMQEMAAFARSREERPQTKYERRGQTLGHSVWDLIFEKRDSFGEDTF